MQPSAGSFAGRPSVLGGLGREGRCPGGQETAGKVAAPLGTPVLLPG